MRKELNSTSPESNVKPIALKNNVLIQESKKELLLYDTQRDKAFCLNETSRAIWDLCNGENTVDDIRHKLSAQLKMQIPEELVWLALYNLKQEKLLSNSAEIRIGFNGLSRREVIKNIGLTTVAALPLISTIFIPAAASAQSVTCQTSTFCLCQDLSCIRFGDLALLQDPCNNAGCSESGGTNCQCVGRFFCGETPGTRFGRCGLV